MSFLCHWSRIVARRIAVTRPDAIRASDSGHQNDTRDVPAAPCAHVMSEPLARVPPMEPSAPPDQPPAPRTWVLVASLEHARRGVDGGFVMANHGKRAPLARMAVGDRVVVYSPTTTYPNGEPLKALTIVGEVTGEAPEPSPVIPGGFRRAARLRVIDPIPLADVRHLIPTSKLRFGFFELDAEAAAALGEFPGVSG